MCFCRTRGASQFGTKFPKPMNSVPDGAGAHQSSQGIGWQGQQPAVWRVEVANGRQAVHEDLAYRDDVGEDKGGRSARQSRRGD